MGAAGGGGGLGVWGVVDVGSGRDDVMGERGRGDMCVCVCVYARILRVGVRPGVAMGWDGKFRAFEWLERLSTTRQ